MTCRSAVTESQPVRASDRQNKVLRRQADQPAAVRRQRYLLEGHGKDERGVQELRGVVAVELSSDRAWGDGVELAEH